MSDFLSKFNKDNYQDLINEQEQKKESKSDRLGEEIQSQEQSEQNVSSTSINHNQKVDTNVQSNRSSTRTSRNRAVDENVEIDLDYKRKKTIKIGFGILGVLFASVLIFFIYHTMVHVKLENFVGKPVSEARTWAKENEVEIELLQEHNKEYNANHIISQSVQEGEKIRKGSTLQLTVSLGPDPDEVIPLPDFSTMTLMEAENWIEENKADNLQIVKEFSDEIEEGSFIKLTIMDSDIEPTEYKRKHRAAVYYSKGKEVFEKNIVVPDFKGKAKEEVETWANTNEIEITFVEEDSDEIEAGFIIRQSVAPDEKVAKRDTMEVVVSVGKAVIVPDFSKLNANEAATSNPDLNVTVKQVYNENVPYGRFISQSVGAGTKLLTNDDKSVTVTYSLGKPYLKDFRGQLEGDLPSLFFEEYESKGANIKYVVKYVDAPEVKGTIVGMSKFNEYVPLKYTVEIHVSNNENANPIAHFEEELNEGEEIIEDIEK